MSVTKRFYVYEHVRTDTGVVFYVGKGTLRGDGSFVRSTEVSNRSEFWRRIVKRSGGFRVEIVAVCATEPLAFAVERAMIALYGRRVDGGSLCNLTLGGEGHCGLPMSPAARAAVSARFSGSGHPNWGKKLSAETCRRKSESMKVSRRNLRGKKLPQWWRDKIRAGKYGERNPMFGMPSPRRKAVVLADGAPYPSVTAAARAAGLSIQGLANMLTGFRPNTIGARYA